MKKWIWLLLLALLVSALSACGGDDAIPAGADADVDLTQLSSTMLYSEVYSMVYEPEKYEGKTVKITGGFSVYEVQGRIVFACLVPDATQCCAQGLEFEPGDGYVYPDDFPAPGTEITVLGTFTSRREESGGNYYLSLVLEDAELIR